MIEDFNQCRDTVVNDIVVYEVPTSDFSILESYQGVQGQVLFTNLTEGADYYEWDFGNGETSIEVDPMATYTEDGTYLITLVSYNEYGCPDSTFLEYTMLFKSLYMPNAFVPKGSVKSVRVWMPQGVNIKTYQVDVYNMWGNRVWSSSLLWPSGSPKEGWNGHIDNDNSEEIVTPGNYIWKASATFIDGSVWTGMADEDGNLSTSGTITVIR